MLKSLSDEMTIAEGERSTTRGNQTKNERPPFHL